MVDRCQFLSDESPLSSTSRVSTGLNTNGNDVKLRDNRAVHFRHWAVIGGSSSIITGNHFFQGDNEQDAPRTPGIILTRTNNRATINGNYVDNCFIEWVNETDAAPEFSSEFSFSSLSITNNVFLASSTASSFKFIIMKPYGSDHFIDGMTVTGNTFRIIGGESDRVEGIDTSRAAVDFDRFQNIRFADNAFHNVQMQASNPLVINHQEASPQSIWNISFDEHLPFNGFAQTVEAIVPVGPLQDASNNAYWGSPYYTAKQGPKNDQITLNWERPVKGTITMRVRMDDPR